MKQMEEAKRKYDEIPVPEELSRRVMDAVQAAEKERNRAVPGRRPSGRWIGRSAAAAAAVILLFTVGLNTSVAFAESMTNLPVLGTVAKVLLFRSYEEETEDLKISIEIPSVEMIGEDLQGTEREINEQIYRFCEEYAEEARARAEEYRRAFLDTGGTQEEWEAHRIAIRVWYEVKSQTAEHLSFVVTGSENWTSAYQEFRYYNLDLKTGRQLTLQDVLGENALSEADEQIRQQIEERRAAGEIFWTEEEGGFAGIREDADFYLNNAGNPVVVFDPYTIAPGSSGRIEFELERTGAEK